MAKRKKARRRVKRKKLKRAYKELAKMSKVYGHLRDDDDEPESD